MTLCFNVCQQHREACLQAGITSPVSEGTSQPWVLLDAGVTTLTSLQYSICENMRSSQTVGSEMSHTDQQASGQELPIISRKVYMGLPLKRSGVLTPLSQALAKCFLQLQYTLL